MGWLTISVETYGGLAVLLGALVPLVTIPMAAVLLVAIVTVHLPYGFSSIKLQAVTAAGAQFGPRALKPIFSTLRASRVSCWGAQDH
jgi:putative oxidoreductase